MGSGEYTTTIQALLNQLREHGHADPLSEIDRDGVRRAINEIKTSTSLGLDQWEVVFLKSLDGDALDELVVLLQAIERRAAWPSHILMNIIVLMGKPGGGSRPIALMPMLYRIWTKVRKRFIQEWDTLHQGPWDAAVSICHH